MITKYYSVTCDECGYRIVLTYSHNIKKMIKIIRGNSGIVSKYGHFCSKKCYNEFI